jgi:hypothetical protein
MTPIIYYAANKICLIDHVGYIHREVSTSISRSMKLNAFFYEQIDSGNILLEFYKNNALPAMYDSYLESYLGILLRIYCLIDYEDLDKKVKSATKEKIVRYYKKYYKDYKRVKSHNLIKKWSILFFRLHHDWWAKIAGRLYYRRG